MSHEKINTSIAVVVPLYNKRAAVTRSIASVFRQEGLPDELVVVDDGSTDGSLSVAEAALQNAPTGLKCTIVSQTNAGVSVARNRGADHATADFIAFLDADDEWLPGHLAEVERLAAAFPSAGFLTTRHGRRNVDGTLIPEPCSLPTSHFGVVDDPIVHYRRGYGLIHTSAAVVRRDAWQRSGGFPVGARKSQDMHLWLRLCLAETMAYSAVPLVVWHDDYSGVAARKGVVPCHFSYFLGEEDGRRHLNSPQLVDFLGSNMLAHIGGHRLSQDDEVVRELQRLAIALPWRHRLACAAVSAVPSTVLRVLVLARRRARGLRG